MAPHDLFESFYLPAFDSIFKFLDIENFTDWAYPCALKDHAHLRGDIYENIDKIVKIASEHSNNQAMITWDVLIQNFGILVEDFKTVYSIYAIELSDGNYWVNPFYKTRPQNERRNEDLSAYNEHISLIQDLLCELTRFCNLLLERIREIVPNYKRELGLLYVDMDAPTLIYEEEEISDTPYPGIKEFIKVRLSRKPHYGSTPSISIDGYEVE